MAYDLQDIKERVREYIAARHPGLHFEDNCSLAVVVDPQRAWMFYIQYRNPAMSKKHMWAQFSRYTIDFPQGTMDSRDGCGGDYITVRSGRPLLIGDGDDTGAVTAEDGLCTIWLRAI